MRTQHRLRKNADSGIDDLFHLLKRWDDDGGVGRFQFDNMQICGIQVQHPLLREVGKLFGKVSTMDATHHTTQHDECGILITVAGQDSFGHLYHAGCSFESSENGEAMQKLLNLLGIQPETMITDASKASFYLVAALKCGHIVCSFHYRKAFSTAMDALESSRRKALWEAVMKAMKWQGYKNDEELLQACMHFLNLLSYHMYMK
jgi:hypothetical protein